ncbi:MAG: hypothetical protein OQJ97_09615 [Rhodospirillales bacterium]|nr:hypothetical protein [Rhodospirillales bacterium]
MAEVPITIEASQRLNAVVAQSQQLVAEARERNTKAVDARADIAERLRDTANIKKARDDEEEFRLELLQKQRIDDEIRQQNLDAIDAGRPDRTLPRGSLVDLLA